MSLIRTIIDKLSGLRTRSLSASAAAWARGGDGSLREGAEMGNAMQQSVWVYACVRVLSETVANTAFRFSRVDGKNGKKGRNGKNEGDEIVGAGPVVELFARPHPYLSRYEFWELLVAWLMLRGRTYVVATTESGEVCRISGRMRGDAVPTRILILNSDGMTRVTERGQVSGWKYAASQSDAMGSYVFLPEEIVYLRLPNPWDFWGGQAPLGVALLAAQTDYAAAQFMRGLMLNNADSGLTVSTDQRLAPEQRDQVLAALRERKRKAGTADRPLILEGGLRVEKPGITTADLQFLENRKYSRQEVCAVFGVAQELLGYSEDANRAVSDAARLNFIENRMVPLCARLADGLAPIVRIFGDDLVGWFDADDLPAMQAARRARVDTATKLFAMGYPVNDVNESLDLGMPMVPWGDVGYLPFGLTPAGVGPETLPSGEEGMSVISDQLSVTSDQLSVISDQLSVTSDQAHQCMGAGQYLQSIRGSVRLKKSKLQRFFFEQRGRVLARLESQFGKGVRRGIEDLWDEADEDAILVGRMKKLLLKDLDFGGAQVWAEIGASGDFAVKPEDAMRFLALREKKIRDINAATWSRLKGSLGDGLDAGDTYQELVARVKDVFKTADQTRAETVALSETNTAVNTGRYDAMKQAGVEKKAWLASNLANSRAAHQQAGRDYSEGIPVDQAFRVMGEQLMFPGDPNGSPENTINCKCTSIAILDGKGMRPERWLSWEGYTALGGSGTSRNGNPLQCAARGGKTKMQERSGVLQWNVVGEDRDGRDGRDGKDTKSV